MSNIRSSRIPQWENEAASEGQTLRNEDNAFLPLSSRQISLLCEFCQKNKALCEAAEKTLKKHTWVSSPLQVRPSLLFNCGIRVHARRSVKGSFSAESNKEQKLSVGLTLDVLRKFRCTGVVGKGAVTDLK